jgi:quercetin dioxygenase-like cupin family protein
MMSRRAYLIAEMQLLITAAIVLALGWSAYAQQQGEIKRKPLLKQDATIAGYELIMNVVEIPPGVSEIRHTHPGPLAGYVLEGTLVLEHEGRPTATYKTGDAFLIEGGKVHQGINKTDIPVKLVATLTVEKGKPPTSPAP